jgi:hypothetical protein
VSQRRAESTGLAVNVQKSRAAPRWIELCRNRAVVPFVVSLLLGWAAKVGLRLPTDAVTPVITAVIGFAYYTEARVLDQRSPAVGKSLLSAGLVSRRPVYLTQSAPAG